MKSRNKQQQLRCSKCGNKNIRNGCEVVYDDGVMILCENCVKPYNLVKKEDKQIVLRD